MIDEFVTKIIIRIYSSQTALLRMQTKLEFFITNPIIYDIKNDSQANYIMKLRKKLFSGYTES